MTKMPCRKCGYLNPPTNQYCAECAAVLAVSTMEVSAQPKTFVPKLQKFRFRFLFSGIFVVTGLLFLATILSFLQFKFLFSIHQSAEGSLLEQVARMAPFGLVISGLLILGAFGCSGILLSRMKKQKAAWEAFLSSLMVATILGSVFAIISYDLVAIIVVFSVPASLCAGLGGWFGYKSLPGER